MSAGSFLSSFKALLLFAVISLNLGAFCQAAEEEKSGQGTVSAPGQVSGYKFNAWSAEGAVKLDTPEKPASKATFAPNDKNASVSASFKRDENFAPNLRIRINGQGSTEPAAGNVRCPNGTVKVKATAANEFRFSKWEIKGDAKIADPNAVETEISLNENAELIAFFAPTMAKLRCNVSGGGTCSPASGQELKVALNEPQQISAQALPGYKFNRWHLGGNGKIAKPTDASTTVTLQGETHVTAEFVGELAEFGSSSECDPVVGDPSGGRAIGGSGPIVTVYLGTSGEGSTTPMPGHYSGNPCRMNVQARAAKDWTFQKWMVDGRVSVDDPFSPEATATVKGGGSIRAVFVMDNVTLNLRTNGNGSTRPAPKENIALKSNQPLSVSAIPGEGHKFVKWQTDGPAVIAAPNAADSTVTLTGNASLTAIFAPDTPPAPPKAATAPTPPPAQVAAEKPLGTIVKLTQDRKIAANAPAGYRFEKWVVSGGATVADSSAPNTSLRFSKDSSKADVTAIFLPENASLKLAVDGKGSTSPAAGQIALVPISKPVSIEAVPATGTHFVNWLSSGPLVLADAKAAKTTATLSGNASATAVFAPDFALLTLEIIGGGELVPYSDKPIQVQVNTPSPVSAKALQGFRFSEWMPLDKNLTLSALKSPSTNVTLSSNAKLRAIFVPESATLTLGVSGNGQTSPVSYLPVSVKTDAWQPVTAFPGPNSEFSSWSVTGDASIANPQSRETQIIVRSGTALLIANMKTLPEKPQTAVLAKTNSANDDPKTGSSKKDSSTAGTGSAAGLGAAPPPPAPQQLVATDGEFTDKVQVRWGDSIGANRYEVWRAGENESLSKAVMLIGNWSGTIYNDINAEPGVNYKYWVRGSNASGSGSFSGSDIGYRRK